MRKMLLQNPIFFYSQLNKKTIIAFCKNPMKHFLQATLYIVLILAFTGKETLAQQLPQFTQYRFNQLAFNPAYAGSRYGVSLEALARLQWTSIEGRPFTQSFSTHLPLPLFNSGMGINIINDTEGAIRSTSGKIAYSYRFRLSKNATLATGLEGTFFQKSLNGSKIKTPGGVYDDVIDHQDPLLENNKTDAWLGDAGLGLYFKNKFLEIGLSTQQLLDTKARFFDNTNLTNSRHFNLAAAYIINLNSYMELSPSLLFKSDLKKYQIDLNIMLVYDDNYLGGLTWRGIEPRSIDALGIIGGMYLGNFMIAYSYDFSLSALNSVNTGSHEIVLHYLISGFFTTQKGKTIYNPRFL